MYARRSGGRELTFDFAQALINDNLLFVDRETGSLWSQLHGGAVSGPLEGTPLETVPSLQNTWKFWRQRHPDTLVVVEPKKEGRPYLYRNRKPGTPLPEPRPTTHDTSALGLGLFVDGKALFFPFHELEQAPLPLSLKAGDKKITIHYRPQALTAWAEDSDGVLLPGVLAYQGGWLAFNPASEIFGQDADEK